MCASRALNWLANSGRVRINQTGRQMTMTPGRDEPTGCTLLGYIMEFCLGGPGSEKGRQAVWSDWVPQRSWEPSQGIK